MKYPLLRGLCWVQENTNSLSTLHQIQLFFHQPVSEDSLFCLQVARFSHHDQEPAQKKRVKCRLNYAP